MLIGVSGKMNSGKDLVGRIIQYLELQSSYPNVWGKHTFDFFLDYGKSHTWESNWEIKKYADKLKDILCLLIGCTREQLEDREFKEKELGEEWNKLQVTYSDGYDEVTDILESNFNFENLLDAKGKTAYIHKKEILKFTPRKLLQQIGTDLMRNQLHPNTWVNATLADYKQEIIGQDRNEFGIYDVIGDYPNWIITDVRFPNEAKAITNKGGINIRIERDLPCTVCGITKAERRGKQCNEIICPNGRQQHESETALDDYNFDYVINNNGTIEELIHKIKEILLIEKII